MLAPAYFSPNYKYFDQLLQTVKNKTTVLILVFKDFLQTSIRPPISLLYAKGYHNFPLKNFHLTVPKNFVREPFSVSLISGIKNYFCIREGVTTFLGPKIFVTQYQKSSLRKCFTNINSTTDFYILCKRVGYHDFSLKMFCLTIPKNFVGEHFGSSENFGYRKILCFREGGITFSIKSFFHTVSKNFIGEHFGISEKLVCRKILCMRRGYHSTLLKTFCLTVPKKFVGEHFSVPEKFFYRKFSGIGWGHHGFVEFFCPTGPKRKVLWRIPSVFRKFSGIKKNYGWKGSYHVFPSDFFRLTVPKIFVGIPSLFQKFWAVEKFYA